ncbi:DUF3237 domain-containing protein [Ideonella sp. DXS22W]|uniref:DUF3237 domain-containing protein n=1 Tax=Pseudaquabacterium inlustre TaxID=2984192 RepID=A0ABU9CGP7_9BURK
MSPTDAAALRALADTLPAEAPGTRLAWRAAVTVAEREALGTGPTGERFIVPITGGAFWGGPAHPQLHGHVRTGGADRQLLRADGIKELDALYELQVHDGTVITVRNHVRIDEAENPRYARSVVQVTAPAGPWAWLNRRVFVGTLHSLRPQAVAVLVSVFELV